MNESIGLSIGLDHTLRLFVVYVEQHHSTHGTRVLYTSIASVSLPRSPEFVFASYCNTNPFLIHPPHNHPRRLNLYHRYTLIQILCLALCWAVNLSPAGLLFSLVVICLVPFRIYVVGKIFSPEECEILDKPEIM